MIALLCFVLAVLVAHHHYVRVRDAGAEQLSFPKIISGRIGDAALPRLE
jgi:hypothetical protein